MATKKKIEPIKGLAKVPENMLVQKSLPLFGLWRSKLTLAEFKILDTYLARIDSRKPDKRVVDLEKGELEQLLGVKKINTSELKERLKHLMESVVEVDDPTKTKSFRLVSLFEEAQCEQDEYGLWCVHLECTQKAMKYFFNTENLGYLRYKLRCVVALSSRYSYILFAYIESNRFRKIWEVEVNELKRILHCEMEETYKEFKRFNDRLLKRCYKELSEKTECRFTYEPVKKGRIVRTIRFTVETLPDLDISHSEQIAFDDYECDNDDIGFLQGACCLFGKQEPEFTRVEMEQIFEILTCVPRSKLPPDPTTGTNDIRFQQYHYLSICYAKMNRAAEKTKIKNRFSYFCKILEGDAKIED